MNELDREIFDDLILCFFNLRHSLNSPPGNVFRDVCIKNFKDAFPEGEVCEEIREVLITRSCGCCDDYKYLPANYIKEIN